MKKIMFGVVLTAALWLASAASAFAWHVDANCSQTGNTIVGTAQWYGFSYGLDKTYLEVLRFDAPESQYKVVAGAYGTPTQLPSRVEYPVPVIDEFTGKVAVTARTYEVRARFTVAEKGIDKAECVVVPPPVYDCKGNPVPPGQPIPDAMVLCPPPAPPAPPVVAPPVPPVVTPPPPPAPKRCVGPYHIKVSKGATLVKVTFLNDRGKRVRANYLVNGRERVKNQRVLKYSHKQWRGVKSIRARHALFPATIRCGAFKRVTHRPPPTVPPFAG